MSPARVLILKECCATVHNAASFSAVTSNGLLAILIAMSVALFGFSVFEAGYVDSFVYIHPSLHECQVVGA